jgi:hypothetical protein
VKKYYFAGTFSLKRYTYTDKGLKGIISQEDDSYNYVYIIDGKPYIRKNLRDYDS